MKIQSFPIIVNIFNSSVVIVKMIRPAFVMTPIVVDISNIVCQVPVQIYFNIELFYYVLFSSDFYSYKKGR